MSRIKFNVLILLVVIVSGCGGGDGEVPPTVITPTPADPSTPIEPLPPADPNRFDNRYNDLEPRPWWMDSEPYSCDQPENPYSPWRSAWLIDLGGSDPLSLVRYFGNGRYIRYSHMELFGCTQLAKYVTGYNLDSPVDPTYYSLGDLDIYVDIARVPVGASNWQRDDGNRVDFSMERAVELLNQYVSRYFERVSENNLRITFHAGNEFRVGGDGSPGAAEDQQISELGICGVNGQYCEVDFGRPGGLNRILLNDVSADTAGYASHGWGTFGLASFRDANMETIVHEIGHGWMRWPHSFAEVPWEDDRTNRANPYSNVYDVMSSLGLLYPTVSGWDTNMPSTLAINRYSAGWIKPENVALHLEDTATYKLSRPRENGYQFLVIHSGRPYAFTTLEVLEERSSKFQIPTADVYDPSAFGAERRRRYEGVLVSRYDQSSGTGTQARFGPALYNKNNPNFLTDVGWRRDDYSVIPDGGTRDIGGGVSVGVTRNSDGSYEVTVSGGKEAEFQKWCYPIWFSVPEDEDQYDTGCLLNERLSRAKN